MRVASAKRCSASLHGLSGNFIPLNVEDFRGGDLFRP